MQIFIKKKLQRGVRRTAGKFLTPLLADSSKKADKKCFGQKNVWEGRGD
jgi:hypothetical protein